MGERKAEATYEIALPEALTCNAYLGHSLRFVARMEAERLLPISAVLYVEYRVRPCVGGAELLCGRLVCLAHVSSLTGVSPASPESDLHDQ